MALGYALWDDKVISIVLSDGPLLESGKFYDADEYRTIRIFLRLKYKITIAKVIVLDDGTDFLQQSVLSVDD